MLLRVAAAGQDETTEAATRPDVELIGLDRLYQGS